MSAPCWVDSVMSGRPWPVVFAVSVGLWFFGALSLGAVYVALRVSARSRRRGRMTGDVLRRLTFTTLGEVRVCSKGEALSCLECGRTRALELVAEDRGADGFAAWIRCPCGHESQHPALTYPAVLIMAQRHQIQIRMEGEQA